MAGVVAGMVLASFILEWRVRRLISKYGIGDLIEFLHKLKEGIA